MSGFDFKMEFDDHDFQRVCSQLIGRGQRLQPLMLDLGEMLLDSTRQRFATKTAPDGSAWKPLKPATLKRKKGRGSLLVLDGYLRDLMRAEADDDSVEVGSAQVYAALHQFGGAPGMKPGTADVEARPFLGLSIDDRRNVLDIAMAYLAEPLP